MVELSRRAVVGGGLLLLAGCSEAKAAAIVVHRDPGCGCCNAWTDQLRASLSRSVEVFDTPDRRPLQQKAGMPVELASCHTAVIDGMIFEGHVPLADLKRVLAQRPAGVNGLAVPGMPAGSPGMETDPPRLDAYEVIAFGTVAPYVFARYGAG